MSSHVVLAALAPSSLLVPAATLLPRSEVFSGGPIAPHIITMGIGVGGALVDVSAWVEFGEGITRGYGRTNEFDDVSPGVFTFVLNNSDGRFTPDNPTSPLATTVAEGMAVCWQLGTRLVAGNVLSVQIPDDEATWHHLVVTCDDMLGAAGRHMLTDLADELLRAQGQALLWRLDEEDGASSSAEDGQDSLGAFTLTLSDPTSTTQALTFGIDQQDGLPGTALTLTAAPGETNTYGTGQGTSLVAFSPATNPNASVGFGSWNMWVYPGSTINLSVVPYFDREGGPAGTGRVRLSCTPTAYTILAGDNLSGGRATYTLTPAQVTVPHYVTMSLRSGTADGSTYNLYVDLSVDGVKKTSTSWSDLFWNVNAPVNTAGAMTPVQVGLTVTCPATAASNVTATVQRVSMTLDGPGGEQLVLVSTLEQRRGLLDRIADEIQSATYAGPLSTGPIGHPDVDDTSILDAFNLIARTEAGHLFSATTGTVTAPSEQIQVRARDRPTVVAAAFDVTLEADGPPAFVRDITNVAAQLQVTGPTQDITVTDPTITGRYVTSGTSETVLYTGLEDLREWGEDRLARGRNRAIRADTITIDAVSTPIDRTADLLALEPGDRIRLTGAPAARLGFSTWDGWLIGGAETHTVDGNRFTFTLTPVLPDPAVYDTALLASGGDVTTAAAIDAAATSLSVAVASQAAMSSVVPYLLLIDREQVMVTAVSGSMLTVTRGAAASLPAPHVVGTPIEVVPAAVYAY